MRVAFRADASIQMGTGHVMRCLTLAEELRRQGHRCRFICREQQGHLGELIVSKGFELRLLPVPSEPKQQVPDSASNVTHAQWLGTSWQQDAKQTFAVLSSLKADWLVVDHYALDARWERELAGTVAQVMAIDDLADRKHACSLLLDQNLGRRASHYNQWVPQGSVQLVGPEYALLRPEFSKLRERSLHRRENPQIKRILISMGGVDRNNATGLVLSSLAEVSLPAETELDIILGASAPHLQEVRKQAQTLPFNATVNVNVSDMAERMCLADFSIGAAGGTSWERCCLGLPAMLIVLAANQLAGAKALEAAGAAISVGSPEEIKAVLPALLDKVKKKELLQRMVHSAANVTSGSGVAGVVEIMVKIAGESK